MASSGRATIADRVRDELADHQKSQRDLARVLDLDHKTVWRRLHGITDFRAEELATIADWLGVEVAKFYTGERVA